MFLGAVTTYEEAVEYLDRHIGLGWKPGLDRIELLLELMGSPHRQFPVIHITGTNGKTTVARAVSAILTAMGLKVGMYTSPHLERIEERFVVGGERASEEAFAQAIADVAPFVDVLEDRTGERPTYFELTTAGAFASFAEAAVDVGVIEVGLGGRLDATNVVESEVAVLTSVAIEHVEYLGGTHESIATEKLAIVKPGGVLVTGRLPDEVETMAAARARDVGVTHRAIDRDFHLADARLAVGGWSIDVDGVYDRYEEVVVPLHGRHQAENAAVAIAAVEELFGQPLGEDVARDGLATLRSPGRIEVVGREPLTIVDGAHNPQAFEALATTLRDEFPDLRWTLVVGSMEDKDLAAMLESMDGLVVRLFATAAESERAREPSEVVDAAAAALPDTVASVVPTVEEAVRLALAEATSDDDGVVIAGSLYVAGEAKRLFA